MQDANSAVVGSGEGLGKGSSGVQGLLHHHVLIRGSGEGDRKQKFRKKYCQDNRETKLRRGI